jgi:hypothetical protein
MDKSEVEYLMAAYTLRAADLEYVRKQASMYAELKPGYRSWFPIETIPKTDVSKWYTLNRVVTPAITRDGSEYVGVRTARTEDSAPIIWMRYKFHWPITEVEAAQRNGIPLRADDAMVGLQQIDNKIMQMIIDGLDYPDTINGLTEDGTDLGATLDTTMVGTAGSFVTHAATAYNHLLTTGAVRPPYEFIVSDTIAQYLLLHLDGGVSQKTYIEQMGFNIHIERAVATASLPVEETLEETIYPMVYTADNGIWVALKNDPAEHALQQFFPPTVSVNPELNRETNMYEGFVEWAGTLRLQNTSAAGFMEDVDVS